MSEFLRRLFESAVKPEVNPYLRALIPDSMPERQPMQPMDVAGMASPQVGMGMAVAQAFQQPLPQSPGEWWDRVQQQGQAMMDPSQAPLMLLGKIGPTPAAFSGALQGTKVLNKRGVPRMVFHGTPTPFERFNVRKSDPQSLAGPGIYFTENPYVAGGGGNVSGPGYAGNMAGAGYGESYSWAGDVRKLKPVLLKRIVESKHPEAPSAYQRATMPKYAVPNIRLLQELDNMGVKWDDIFTDERAPNVRPAYLRIKKPLDLDKPVPMFERYQMINALIRYAKRGGNADAVDLQTVARLKEQTVIGKTIMDFARTMNLERDIPDIVRAGGYDGITHIGGTNTNTKPHRVWIALSGGQIVPAYGPKVGEGSFKRSTAPAGSGQGTVFFKPQVWREFKQNGYGWYSVLHKDTNGKFRVTRFRGDSPYEHVVFDTEQEARKFASSLGAKRTTPKELDAAVIRNSKR